MNALYFVAARTGDGSEETPYRPWFRDLPGITGWAGTDYKALFLGQVFAKDQATLDTIAADARTVFSIPVVVNGEDLSWSKANLSSTERAKIDTWLSSQSLKARPAGERSPGTVVEHVMKEVNEGRLPAKGVLDGWRVHW